MLTSRVGLFAAALSISTLLGGALLAPTPGYAQDDVRKRGDKACGGDSRRMCSKFFGQGDMAVLSCLQQNKVKLGRSCHKFLTEIGQLY